MPWSAPRSRTPATGSSRLSHRGDVARSWVRFQATALLGAGLGMAIVALGVWFGLHYIAAQMLATLTALGLTFLINRRWTFG